MLNIVSSHESDKNSQFHEVRRQEGKSNEAWLKQNLRDEDKRVSILLLGGTDTYAFRLRVAQSHVRHDMTPSRWSHIGIIGPAGKESGARNLYEISLQPQGGLGFPACTNGVQEKNNLEHYNDSKKFPNLAVLRIPVDWADVEKALGQFQRQRAILDAPELILHWLAFVWGVGRAGNPLLDGHGIPSAAMVETVVGAAGYDLTPGLESGASCPEAIWQSALWWSRYYSKQQKHTISGSWTGEHQIG